MMMSNPTEKFMLLSFLCSSAFMSLASRFPLQSKSSKKSYDVDTNTLLKEAGLCIVNPADTITSYGYGTLNQPTYHLGNSSEIYLPGVQASGQ